MANEAGRDEGKKEGQEIQQHRQSILELCAPVNPAFGLRAGAGSWFAAASCARAGTR